MSHWILALFALTSQAGIEFGHQFAERFEDSTTTRNRLYIFAAEEWNWTQDSGTNFKFSAGARAWDDLETSEIRSLFAQVSSERISVNLGFQEIPWGETFGFFISDIVNPRDFTDPLMTDIGWTRLPVFALNAQFFQGPTSVQLISVPFPRNNKLPQPGDPFYPSQASLPLEPQPEFSLDEKGKDGEFGSRISTLFDFGLSASAFYYSHWNRSAVYEIQNSRFGPNLTPIVRRVHSLGLSGSYALDLFVFRGDSVMTLNEPQMQETLSPHRTGVRWQNILGADVSLESGWVIGAQYHTDYREFQFPNFLNWSSMRVQKELVSRLLKAEVFAFFGLGNPDGWIGPSATLSLGDHFSATVRGDFLWSTPSLTRSALGSLGEEDRVMTWLSYKL